MKIVLVAAVAENGVIGRDKALPWHIRSDLQHFKRITLGRPVIMGRKTYDFIGKPLKDRTNIVMTRDPDFEPDDVVIVKSLEKAMQMARDDAERRGVEEIAVIGGSGVFRETMLIADRLEITLVHMEPEGDTFFPPIDTQIWREIRRVRQEAAPQDDADISFITYERMRP